MDEKSIITNHVASFHSRLNDLRIQKQLVDFTICVGDEKILVHKTIMASCSDYFKALLMHRSIESSDNVVNLKEVSVTAMKAIVDFCYKCQLDLTVDNVQEILIAAMILQIPAVQELCVDFIRSRIDISNCLAVATIADRFNLQDLLEFAVDYCASRFDSLVGTEEFLALDEHLLKKILAHDQLYFSDEVDVFHIIIRWVREDEQKRLFKLDDLMEQVRFALIDPVRLISISSTEFIRNSSRCRDFIDAAKNYILLKRHSDGPNPLEGKIRLNTKPRRPPPRRHRIIAVGGWIENCMSINRAEIYDPNLDQWSDIAPMTKERCGVGLATLDNNIYAIGGHDGKDYLRSIERYDTKEDKWDNSVPDMHDSRTSCGVVVLDGQIYAIGGQNITDATDKVERYDPTTKTWSACASLNKRRLGLGVAVLNGYIYVMGGSVYTTTHDSVERYNPDLDSWTYVAPMKTARKHLGCTAFGNKIYAIGGRNAGGYLGSVECYDPDMDAWTSIKPMQMKRCGIGVTELGGLIYSIGGQAAEGRLDVVEVYNPETEEWTWRQSMNLQRLGGGVAAYLWTNPDVAAALIQTTTAN